MKTTSKALLVAVLLFPILAVPLRAQNDAPTKDEPAAVTKDQASANEAEAGRPAVRIDNTGVHVGGEDPVDINLPNLGGNSVLGPLLPIISVLMVFGMPVVVVGLFVLLRHRRNRMLHDTLRAMVEKGVPIPPELILGGAARPDFSNGARHGDKDLRYGLVLIALGAALFVVAGKFGVIPLFIGAALLVVWLIGLLANRKRNSPAQ